mgnify:CR=1 FL=1
MRRSGASGSSPLARGLPGLRARVRGMRGIIPARAGFTAGRVLRRRVREDHPRSRGVYMTRCPPPSQWEGSSPLARGLPLAGGLHAPHHRIIPARAGFTPPRGWAAGAARDHPRSRGVYDVDSVGLGIGEGSSPLARGLLEVGEHPPPGGGIIPARAGFTSGPGDGHDQRTDHPRSRGVYRRTGTTRRQY